jgi:DNA helicase-2/ATP-dependent DNA helicase PcrA
MDEPGRLEEERRLCYVGMTRSMQQLYLCYAEVRRQYGREQYHKPSRFLAELPSDLIHAIRPKSSKVYRAPSMPSFMAQDVKVDCPFQVGQQVSHSHFGSGVVLALEGQGEQMRIQVRFNQHGAKWLVLAYAKLKPIS